MQLKELEEMYQMESDHWWYTGKRLLFRKLLSDRLAADRLRILDVGCGTGAVSREFSEFGQVVSADRSLDALKFARSRGVEHVVESDAAGLPFPEGCFDLILAFDVIEHVDDDRGFVRALAKTLKPGGALAVHVPAWPSLWTKHDDVLEHKRRYTRRSLKKLFADCDMDLEYFGWASCTLLAGAVAVRGLKRITGDSGDGQDLGVVPAPVNSALIGLYQVETTLAATTGLPFGLSLAAVAVPRA